MYLQLFCKSLFKRLYHLRTYFHPCQTLGQCESSRPGRLVTGSSEGGQALLTKMGCMGDVASESDTCLQFHFFFFCIFCFIFNCIDIMSLVWKTEVIKTKPFLLFHLISIIFFCLSTKFMVCNLNPYYVIVALLIYNNF